MATKQRAAAEKARAPSPPAALARCLPARSTTGSAAPAASPRLQAGRLEVKTMTVGGGKENRLELERTKSRTIHPCLGVAV